MSEPGPPTPVLDPDRYAELAADLGADRARERLERLVSETDHRISAATAAHADEDGEAVAQAAHAIKEDARLVGATRLHGAAAALEEAVGDPRAAAEAIDALAAAWGSTRPRLTAPPAEGRA